VFRHHPERSEGSGCLLEAAVTVVQARTEIPRFARDEKSMQSAYSMGEDVHAYTDRRQLCMF